MVGYGHYEALKDLEAIEGFSRVIDMVDCLDSGSHLNYSKRLRAYVSRLEAEADGGPGPAEKNSDCANCVDPLMTDALEDGWRLPYGRDEVEQDLAAARSITLVIDMANDFSDESRLAYVDRLAGYIHMLEAEAASNRARSALHSLPAV